MDGHDPLVVRLSVCTFGKSYLIRSVVARLFHYCDVSQPTFWLRQHPDTALCSCLCFAIKPGPPRVSLLFHLCMALLAPLFQYDSRSAFHDHTTVILLHFRHAYAGQSICVWQASVSDHLNWRGVIVLAGSTACMPCSMLAVRVLSSAGLLNALPRWPDFAPHLQVLCGCNEVSCRAAELPSH